MGLPKLWGKDKEGNRGFAFSHVKTIYYNWASKILLKTKLDEMDALIDAKIAKAMMSNQQVNDTNKVPTSALAYLMSQNITKNANDISSINGNLSQNGNTIIYATSQAAMDGLFNWIMNAPNHTMITKVVVCEYHNDSINGDSISGNLAAGTYLLIGYRRNNYAHLTAYSYWGSHPMSVATIENGVWAKRFEKVITNSDLVVETFRTAQFTIPANSGFYYNDLVSPQKPGYTLLSFLNGYPEGFAGIIVQSNGWAYNPTPDSKTISIITRWLFIKV